MTAITTTQITISPEDFIKSVQGALRTTSLKVAEAFGKNHRDVLRKIDGLDCTPEFTSAHFCAHEEMIHAGAVKRLSRVVEMDKDGFMFLVMGFTGQKAAQIKEAYINAFNWMAEKLGRAPTSVDDRKPLNRAVRTLANLRSAQGESADYAGMWKLVNGYLGLAHIEDANPEQLDRAMMFVQESIERETAKIIEGDYIARQAPPEPEPQPAIHYPMEAWPDINPQLRRDWANEIPTIYPNRRWVKAHHLYGESAPSPTLHLLAQLKKAGFNVACCEAEISAMRHHIGEGESLRRDMERLMGRSNSMAVMANK